MKIILPVKYPTITSYPGRAYLYAIAEGNNKIYPWLMENFIQTESYLNIYEKYCDIDFLNMPQIRYSSNTALEAQNTFCQYIENMSIYAEIIGYDNVVDFIRKSITDGYYIVIDINTQYIMAYKDIPHLHNMMIYGFDDEIGIFYIADFFAGKYEQSTCEFEDVKKATMCFEELSSPFYSRKKGLISLFRVNEECKHDFNAENFKNTLSDYLNNKEVYKTIFRNTNYYNKEENDMRSFGNLHFDNLISFLNWCKSDNTMYVSKWAFSVFCDHKKSIYQRLGYLNKTSVRCNQEIESYSLIVNEALLIRNLYLKCLMRGNVRGLDNIICRIKSLKAEEKSILEKVVNRI